jgi:serine/threonine protein phosphatase PrpC
MELYRQGIKGGSTATCIVIRQNILYVAYVGDSSAMALVCKKGGYFGHTELKKDDRPNDENEQERILRSGLSVYVDPWGAMRVMSYDKKKSLAMSRALGNFDFKNDPFHPENQGVTCIPHVSQLSLSYPVNIVLASDGIWEVASPKDVACMLTKKSLCSVSHISTVLDELANHCIAKSGTDMYGTDNMTCILIQFLY